MTVLPSLVSCSDAAEPDGGKPPRADLTRREAACSPELTLFFRLSGEEGVEAVEAETQVHGEAAGDRPRVLNKGATLVQPLHSKHRVVVGPKLEWLTRHPVDRVEHQLVVAVAPRYGAVSLLLLIEGRSGFQLMTPEERRLRERTTRWRGIESGAAAGRTA